MVIEKENYTISYDDNLSYMIEVIDYLDLKMLEIMSFFELRSLKYKRKIIIYHDLELYKKHIEQFHEYRDYMCADTNDGNINLLSLEEAHKTKTHVDMSIEELKSTIVHEFVHICHQDSEIENNGKSINWFWEALATNLGNPDNNRMIEITASNDEIEQFRSLPHNYSVAFTIGKYLLENYSHENILEYIRYPKKLKQDANNILNEARIWSKKKEIQY